MGQASIFSHTLNLNRVFQQGADAVAIDQDTAKLARDRLARLEYTEDFMRPGVFDADFKRPRPPFPFSRLVSALEEEVAPVMAVFGREASALSMRVRRVSPLGLLDWHQDQRDQAWLAFTMLFPESDWHESDGGLWELARATLEPDGAESDLEVTQTHSVKGLQGLLIVHNPSSLAFRHRLTVVEGSKSLFMVQGTLGGIA